MLDFTKQVDSVTTTVAIVDQVTFSLPFYSDLVNTITIPSLSDGRRLRHKKGMGKLNATDLCTSCHSRKDVTFRKESNVLSLSWHLGLIHTYQTEGPA